MEIGAIIITIAGLCLFETVSSIDNAIINAEVLGTMKPKYRRWFLIYGIFIAVIVVRGALPWLIVWAVNPTLGPVGAFMASFSNDPHVVDSIQASAPILLVGGGTFLILLFLHWLFLEPKNYGLYGERYIESQGVWFYAFASIALLVIVWLALKKDSMMAMGAVTGSTAFFITHGFKENAEQAEQDLLTSHKSDIAKILYLEILDATFSIDGVLGAFAFTLYVPLILIGNGLGAIVVRQLTVGNIERIKKYKYLKNGAMYSILCLGVVMVLESFAVHVPSWLSPVVTFVVVGIFFVRSVYAIRTEEAE